MPVFWEQVVRPIIPFYIILINGNDFNRFSSSGEMGAKIIPFSSILSEWFAIPSPSRRLVHLKGSVLSSKEL